MKKLIPFLSFALFLTACNTGAPDKVEITASKQEAAAPVLDTAGLASYQTWKAQHELTEAKQAEAPEAEVPKTVVYKRAEQRSYAYAPRPKKATPAVSDQPARATKKNNEGSNSTADSGSGATGTEASTGTTKGEEKKGMSKATKGAVIGGVAGAAAGAVLVKNNRAAGAVIGGVVGAIGGHVIGKKMDKKDGRTN